MDRQQTYLAIFHIKRLPTSLSNLLPQALKTREFRKQFLITVNNFCPP